MVEENVILEKPKRNWWRIIRKTFFWLFGTAFFLLLSAILLVWIFEDEVKERIVSELNKYLATEIIVDGKNIELTIIKTFPNAAIEFNDVMAYEALKKEKKDTLFTAENISLQFNVMDIFNKNYTIKKVACNSIDLNLKVDSKGNPNFIIWKTDSSSSSNDSVSFKLEEVSLTNIKFKYRNKKLAQKIVANIDEASISGSFENEDYTLTSDGKIKVTELNFEKRNYLKNKLLKYKFDVDVSNNSYKIKDSKFFINDLSLIVNGSITKTNSSPWFANINAKGDNIDIAQTLSLLPESQQEKVKDYSSEGNFNFDGIIKTYISDTADVFIDANFGVNGGTLLHKQSGSKLSNINLVGSYSKNKKQPETLILKGIRANLNSNSIAADCSIIDFNNPNVDITCKANINLQELTNFYPIDTIQSLKGQADADFAIKGNINKLKSDLSDPSNSATGIINISNLELMFKNDKQSFVMPQGKLTLQNNNLTTENVKIVFGSSDAELSGTCSNFIPWVLKPEQLLVISANVKSNLVSLDEIMAADASTSSGSTNFSLSNFLDLNLIVEVGKTQLGKFSATDIQGKVIVKNQKMLAQSLNLKAMGGSISLDGMLDASLANQIEIKGSATLSDLNAKQVFYQMNNFGQTTLEDKHIKGTLNSNVDFSSQWSKALVCDFSKLVANCNLTINNGELIDFKPLESLSKYVELKELQHIKFSTLSSSIVIKDKVIDISKTKVSNSALNLDIYGKHYFDNRIDYHVKLLLSEVLAKRPGKQKELDEELALVENDPENKRCVYLTITGTVDNPIIKYDRKGMKQKIKEDIKEEKQNLKAILNEEFGLFKKDSAIIKKKKEEKVKAEQKFKVDFSGKDADKKKEIIDEDDDDF